MTENFIKLNKSKSLKIGIKDYEGNDTGNFLTFNLEDVNLPLRYQEIIEKSQKNKNNLNNQLAIIKKRQDIKGKNLFSKNEKDTLIAYKTFFEKQAQIYNLFLGENGVEKLLDGEPLTWTSLNDIDELIEKQILPLLDIKMDSITKSIKEKYGNIATDSGVLK